jgi:hypothetical protein
MAVVAVDHLGTVRSQDVRRIDLALDSASLSRVRQFGLRIHTRLPLSEGVSALRLAVADPATQRLGSLWVDLETPDRGAPISISGVLVTATLARLVPTVNENSEMMDGLPYVPITRRMFVPGETLSWAAEIYLARDARQDATLTTTIKASDQREMLRRDLQPRSHKEGDGAWRVTEGGPWPAIQPGDTCCASKRTPPVASPSAKFPSRSCSALREDRTDSHLG